LLPLVAMPADFLECVRAVKGQTDSVIIGVSCGKDSLAVLDLCSQHFKAIAAYFMYVVEGLEFQERYLGYLERCYGIQIIRIPHWGNSYRLRRSYMRPHTSAAQCPIVRPGDIRNYIRQKTGMDWTATGEKCSDSLDRRKWMQPIRGISEKNRLFYPLWNWTDRNVYAYLQRQKILLPVDYRIFGQSFRLDRPEHLTAVQRHYPDDYAKIVKVYPELPAAIAREQFRTARQASEVHGGADQPEAVEERGLQSPLNQQVGEEEAQGSTGQGGAG
jgi:phosphoadenosine phosphosulfate reductase